MNTDSQGSKSHLLDEVKVKVFPSGIDALDRLLGGGFRSSSITLLAGGPKIGKTTVIIQSLMNLVRAGTKVAIVSLEESQDALFLKCLTSITGINVPNIVRRSARLESEDCDSLFWGRDELERLTGNQLFFCKSSLDVEKLVGEVKEMVLANDIQVVFLDTVQVPWGSIAAVPVEVPHELHALIRATGVALVGTAHLDPSRTVVEDDRPHPKAMLGGKELMQCADYVVNLHRPKLPDTGALDEDSIHFLLAKARFGSQADELDSAYPSQRADFDGVRMRVK
jgi:predicted ATP-dependent serine protease